MALTTSELLAKLEAGGVNMDVAKPIIEETLSESILNRLHCPTTGPMRSYYMRRQHYTNKKIFNVVSPVQKSLGLNQDYINCKYHYVPIKESIKWLMEDNSVYEQYLASRQRRPVLQSDLLTDIHDGSSFMGHSLFMEDPTALQIILYYDDVSLAKALGPANSTFKISHWAFTLGNLKPWHRTKVDPIQLVMLCREQVVSYFGLERVLKPLIEDLKSLEEDGVEIRGEKVKASIALILGDNLAAHTIGGFVESFSQTEHFCRYCEESRSDWLARWYSEDINGNLSESEEDDSSDSDVSGNDDVDDPPLDDDENGSDYSSSDDDIPLAQLFPQTSFKKNVAPLRTKESYNKCVRQLETNPKGVKGVVGNSEFNKLKHYHCVGGMPGCLAHDYLEGVIAYDLILILKGLRKKFKFTWE
ncbi:Anthranilate phosphoribosyltransferase [Frankliniella fusca]|uniref:Anthranilate phosphoribosyltransferase n=1 Tax=Frankliniella fusca TaxID=407009 RepID=A0AAE1LQC5_9NEOP|nr:Anthranilate phosphoribosyltransferase [Frankliniella fusca]